MFPCGFAKAICGGRRTGQNGFVVEKTLQVRARALGVSYRRVRSLSMAFMVIQSSSPRSSTLSFAGSI